MTPWLYCASALSRRPGVQAARRLRLPALAVAARSNFRCALYTVASPLNAAASSALISVDFLYAASALSQSFSCA